MSLFQQHLAKGLAHLQVELDSSALGRLERYFLELRKWSRKFNLVARSSSDAEVVDKHFIDSLSLLKVLHGSDEHLLDIGSGAGFPGLACKIAKPSLQVTLLEPRLKRVHFLKHVIRVISLEKITVDCSRAEEFFAKDAKTVFSHCTARAVTDIQGLFQMLVPFDLADTTIVCMKGPKWREELLEAEQIISSSGYVLVQQKDFVLPMSRAERCILVFQPR